MVRRWPLMVLVGAMVAACGHPAVVSAPERSRTESPAVGAAVPGVQALTPVIVTELISNNSGRLVSTGAGFDGDDPPIIAAMAFDNPPSTWVDDRTPYGVVVAARTATTLTVAWRTETATRGKVSYGRVWGFEKNGYTGSYTDDVAKTDHMVTITGLRRFSAYKYRVSSTTALGLQFPEKERTVRTLFWSWR